MPQFYCQTASRPDPWLLGRTSAGLCTLQTACPLTVTYSGGSPAADTIAAGSAATVYGGSASSFDASADVWVVLTVPGSGALQVVKEADLATVTGDWAGLARVVQHAVEPYQPQASLAAGGLGNPQPTTVTALVSDTTALVLDLSPSTSPPASWYTSGFDDSAWVHAVAAYRGGPTVLDGVTVQQVWPTVGPTTTQQSALVRKTFTPPAGLVTSATLSVEFDAAGDVYFNGTLLGSDTTDPATGPILTFDVTTALVAGASNLLACHGTESAQISGHNTWVAYLLRVTYAGSGTLLPAPASPAEGDLLYYHNGQWVRLPAGTNGYELTLVAGDPAWTAQPASGGTVTSVALAGPTGTTVSGSPVSSSGTLSLAWSSQSANVVLASPNGSSGVPTFRALVAGDIPSLPASQITSGQLAAARGGTGVDGSSAANGTLLIGNGSGYTLATLTAGSGISVVNASGSISIAATGGGGSGTVTSVTLTVPGFLSVSGSPVTTSGTLAVSLANQNQGTVFAGPASGSAAAPTFRALQGSDLPPAAGAGGHIHAHIHLR